MENSSTKKTARKVAKTLSVIGALAAVGFLIYCAVDWIGDEYAEYKIRRRDRDPSYLHEYGNRNVSAYIVFHDGNGGYLYDLQKKQRTLSGITWICRSEDGDSLTFFSNGEKRGFFNRFTGKVVIPAQYDKGWVFNEGVACVMKDHQVQVIDHTGKELLEHPFAYTGRIYSYIFHNGLCPMMDDSERIGLVDYTGQWVIEPIYKEIEYNNENFWLVFDSVWNEGLLFGDGSVFLPCEYADIDILDNIFVTAKNHLQQVYDCQGNLVNPCNFEYVETMSYESDEFVFNDYYEYYDRLDKPAHLNRYETSENYYGLIDKEGRIITPPCYDRIQAIAADRYLCEGPEGAVILNDKGQRPF